MAKGMTLVGLDVHVRQTHAAVLDPATGELGVSRLRMAPLEVVSFLEGLGSGVRAVYEAGPTEIFGDDATAAAMIDRLVHHAELISIKGTQA
jgi:IstB-like ATP binding protein